jgi:ketosteroid isomerase-like protein
MLMMLMKRSLIWSLVSVSVLLSVVWSQSSKNGDTEKAVAALEQTWLQSQKTNNADLIAPHLAEKVVSTSSDGKVNGKAGALAEAKATKWASAEYSDVKVSVFGDTAIATGEFKGKGTDSSGKAIDVTERWTDTWVKMPNGQWQCVATQATPVKM